MRSPSPRANTPTPTTNTEEPRYIAVRIYIIADYKHSKNVLKTTTSAVKRGMYSAKIKEIKTKFAKEVASSIFSGASAIADTAIDDTGNTSFITYALKAAEGVALGAISGRIGGKGSATKHVSNHFGRMLGSGKDDLTYYFSQIGTQAIRDGLKAIPSIVKATIPTLTKTFIKASIQR